MKKRYYLQNNTIVDSKNNNSKLVGGDIVNVLNRFYKSNKRLKLNNHLLNIEKEDTERKCSRLSYLYTEAVQSCVCWSMWCFASWLLSLVLFLIIVL